MWRDSETGEPSGHARLPEPTAPDKAPLGDDEIETDLIAFFAPFTRLILVVLLGSWFYRDPRLARERVRDLGHEHGVDVRIAWDGMSVEVCTSDSGTPARS